MLERNRSPPKLRPVRAVAGKDAAQKRVERSIYSNEWIFPIALGVSMPKLVRRPHLSGAMYKMKNGAETTTSTDEK